ncbi:Sb-PDE family phosphodiesterase [Candidatus Latescibacterota bacterium]
MKWYKANNHRRSVSIVLFILIFLSFSASGFCQLGTRNEIKIPDILGFKTLKADLHIHTVFSDGTVWPTIRIQELWQEGLDVYSITDHIEYHPHKDDMPTNHNRPYEIAIPLAKDLRLSGIKGGEISRGIPPPPGHYNALFLDDIDPLDTPDFMDSMEAAAVQGAFIFWNHPGYGQPNLIPIWYQAQTDVLEKGWLHGIEVANDVDYYPLAHKWCLDNKLTMIGSSDAHQPMSFDYDFDKGEHRPITLIFTRENTLDSIKEALFSRRTAVWLKEMLIGEEKYLYPLFKNSIEILTPELTLSGDGSATVQIRNKSDIPFELVANGENELVSSPGSIILYPDRTVKFGIGSKSKGSSGVRNIKLPYKVKNLYVQPSEGMEVELDINVKFIPEKEGK